MKILIKKARKLKNIEQSGMINNRKAFETFALPLTATWGKVLKAHSEDNTVDVQLSGGMELYHIVVRSLEWAGVGTAGYGERDLPPVDCIVLILFPDSIIENAFVLCSILSTFEQVGAKHKVELLASGKETEHLRIREGKKTILKINGAIITIETTGKMQIEKSNGKVIVNADGSIEITPASGKDIKLAGGTQHWGQMICRIVYFQVPFIVLMY